MASRRYEIWIEADPGARNPCARVIAACADIDLSAARGRFDRRDQSWVLMADGAVEASQYIQLLEDIDGVSAEAVEAS